MESVAETARTGCRTFKRIFELRDEMAAYSLALPNVPLGQRLFKLLYSTPRLTVNQAAKELECDYQTASRLIKVLVRDGILLPTNDARRNVIFDFKRYLDIFKA